MRATGGNEQESYKYTYSRQVCLIHFCCVPQLLERKYALPSFNYKETMFCLRQICKLPLLQFPFFEYSCHLFIRTMLFITHIKWSKGILFACELWIDIQMQIPFFQCRATEQNKVYPCFLSGAWNNRTNIHLEINTWVKIIQKLKSATVIPN